MWTWIIRAGGFILMLIGVAMILKPLSVVADVIPFLGNIVGAGTGILSLLITAPFALLTIAVAWLRYRPLIGIAFLILTMVIAGVIFVLSKRGKASRESVSTGSEPSRKGLGSDIGEHVPLTQPDLRHPDEVPTTSIASRPEIEKTRAIQKNRDDSLKKGRRYFRTGQYDKAVIQFSQIIKFADDKKSAFFNRGVALFKLNRKDAAMRDFKYAAKLGHAKAKAILNQTQPGTAAKSR
jgi:tetratricopeptide (TPR) repeat protein